MGTSVYLICTLGKVHFPLPLTVRHNYTHKAHMHILHTQTHIRTIVCVYVCVRVTLASLGNHSRIFIVLATMRMPSFLACCDDSRSIYTPNKGTEQMYELKLNFSSANNTLNGAHMQTHKRTHTHTCIPCECGWRDRVSARQRNSTVCNVYMKSSPQIDPQGPLWYLCQFANTLHRSDAVRRSENTCSWSWLGLAQPSRAWPDLTRPDPTQRRMNWMASGDVQF